jgi:hypothetical protein
VLVVVAIAVACLAVTVRADAKGVSLVTLTGPTLVTPIEISGDIGSPSATLANNLTDESGLFTGVFADGSQPADPGPPAGDLGPKYQATYTFPGDTTIAIRQDIYPYAPSGPVTFVPTGQAWLGGQLTKGGWYRASPHFSALLITAGLPASAPTPSAASEQPRKIGADAATIIAVALASALLVTTLALFFTRRRPLSPHGAVG